MTQNVLNGTKGGIEMTVFDKAWAVVKTTSDEIPCPKCKETGEAHCSNCNCCVSCCSEDDCRKVDKSWEKVIKWGGPYIGDREAVAAQSEGFHEDLAAQLQSFIDALQAGISSGDGIPKISEGKLEAIFRRHGYDFNITNWF